MLEFTQFELRQPTGNTLIGWDVQDGKRRLGTIYKNSEVEFIATPALKLMRRELDRITDFMFRIEQGRLDIE